MRGTHTLLSLLLVLSGCTGLPQADDAAPLYLKAGYVFPYRLSEPAESRALPNSLVEISGLGFVDDGRLACIQDEKGIIYVYNLNSGKIELDRNFAEDGDYEGIEIVADDAWVLKSNGTLYKVSGYLKGPNPETTEFPTALSGRNDTEGLAYDPVRGNLLIACKGVPFFKVEETSNLKAVYSFNPSTGQLTGKPFLLIDPDSVVHYRHPGSDGPPGKNIQDLSSQGEEQEPFMPSGIAVHPLTGDIYILGSVGKLLLVYSAEGEMLAMISLNRKLFPKPEGICFSPDGKLYISSEGKGQHGKIMLFKSQL
jgi:DNA-binding beta-propeller fold protein YncE